VWGSAASDEVGGSGVLFGSVQVTAVAKAGAGSSAGGGDAVEVLITLPASAVSGLS
jgi:hypothetical protein